MDGYARAKSNQWEHLEGQTTGFLSQLTPRELEILRIAVKKVYMRNYPEQFCTNYEADKMIDVMGPQIAERLLKKQIDAKLS